MTTEANPAVRCEVECADGSLYRVESDNAEALVRGPSSGAVAGAVLPLIDTADEASELDIVACLVDRLRARPEADPRVRLAWVERARAKLLVVRDRAQAMVERSEGQTGAL